MYIKNLWLSAGYKGIYALLVAVALALDFGFFSGRADWHILNYYTILSNIACVVFFALAHFKVEKAARARLKDFAWQPRVEGAIVFCIAVTGIIYAVMLAPADMGSGRFFSFDNMMLHYVGPAMVLVDWLLFCPKGRLRATDPLKWLCTPLVYFGYILVRSTFAGNIGAWGSSGADSGVAGLSGSVANAAASGNVADAAASGNVADASGIPGNVAGDLITDTGSRFPYDFIDPAVQGGWGEMFIGVGWIALGMAALGYLIWLADRLMARK
jgi:hypothetical protein